METNPYQTPTLTDSKNEAIPATRDPRGGSFMYTAVAIAAFFLQIARFRGPILPLVVRSTIFDAMMLLAMAGFFFVVALVCSRLPVNGLSIRKRLAARVAGGFVLGFFPPYIEQSGNFIVRLFPDSWRFLSGLPGLLMLVLGAASLAIVFEYLLRRILWALSGNRGHHLSKEITQRT